MTQRYTLSLLLSFATLFAYSEHLPGGTISARCVGGNFHEVTLKLYRECSGAPMIPQDLHFENDCGVSFDQMDLVAESVEEVSPLCPTDLPNSTCNGGTLRGFQLYTYRTTVFLSPCNSWRINWNICCRNSSVNVQGTPGLFLETSLNNFGGFCNAGAEFVDNTVPLVCVGQPVSYDASATDANGHTLRYGFIDARFNLGTPTEPDGQSVSYFPEYSGAEPFTGMVIDSLTGRITFLPTISGIVYTVVEVNEYDSLGNWVGAVMHDFPFYVSNCDNAVPSVDSGVFNSANGVAEVSADRALLVCSEGAFCALLEFEDADMEQALAITSNITTALPGAELNLSGTNPVMAEVCWNSTGVAAGTYQFSITATDDACPVQAFQQFAYTVTISSGGSSAGTDAEAEYCAADGPFDMLPLLGGAPSEGGSWTDPNAITFGDMFDPGSDEPGDYTYNVGGSGACSGTAVLTLILLPDTNPVCLMIGAMDQKQSGFQVLPDANFDGKFRIISPMSGAYQLAVIGTDGRVAQSQRVQLVRNTAMVVDLSRLATGSYLLRLMGKEGVGHTERIVVQ